MFSGIGGFDLGLERAGMKIAWQIEIDPFCNRVLEKHWPGVKRYGDIRQIKGADMEPVDLVCGGPPCQPVSLAGQRKGAADDRWLWPEALRLVEEIHPRWCLFENPPGFLSMGFDEAVSHLETEGYEVQAFDIPACGVDAPHLRYRIWIVGWNTTGGKCKPQCQIRKILQQDIKSGRVRDSVADSDSNGRCRQATGQPAFNQEQDDQACQFRRTAEFHATVASSEDVPDTINFNGVDVCRSKLQGTALSEPCNHSEPLANTTSKQQPREGRTRKGQPESTDSSEWPTESRMGVLANGLPAGLAGLEWPAEPDIPRVATSIKDRVNKLKALGNAVVVQIPEILGRMIMEADQC